MVRCDYCNAPMMSITTVCPNCHREQPPYPPVLPGGGGKSYRGWAMIQLSLATGMILLAIFTFIQAPYSNIEANSYGSPSVYEATGQAQYLNQANGTPLYPGYGYAIFFGGIAVILLISAFISYNRGQRIDGANRQLLEALRQNGDA